LVFFLRKVVWRVPDFSVDRYRARLRDLHDAHNEGLDEVKASEVPRWRDSTVFAPLERDVMEYAEAMTETPPQVTDELFARLLEQLGAGAMVELTSLVGFANSAARGNVAMGIESQGFSKACALPLAQPSPGYATSA
jgi:alkylhydroperoxidase family enzyme